jgi:hypothetical protein
MLSLKDVNLIALSFFSKDLGDISLAIPPLESNVKVGWP